MAVANYLFETDQIWISVTGGAPEDIVAATDTLGAHYEGYEVLREPGLPEVHGPR